MQDTQGGQGWHDTDTEARNDSRDGSAPRNRANAHCFSFFLLFTLFTLVWLIFSCHTTVGPKHIALKTLELLTGLVMQQVLLFDSWDQ